MKFNSNDYFRSVELYLKGIKELEKGILLDFTEDERSQMMDSDHAKKLQHKMKLNLDMGTLFQK